MKSSLTENPDLDLYVRVWCPSGFRGTRIVVFEFFASLLYTFGLMTASKLLKPDYLASPSFLNAMIMFLTFVISGQLSGGQGNPIISLALLFTKGTNVTMLNFPIYFFTQFVGAIAGGAIGYGTIYKFGCPSSSTNTPMTFGSEILGSFLFIILYLVIMNASTKFQHNFWAYITVPCAFFVSQMLSGQYLGLNPSSVLANQIFFGIKNKDWTYLQESWAYIVGPMVGSLFATLIFNYFLLPIHQRWVLRK